MADYLLEEAGVAVLPGTAFGEGGEGYLRLCFANSMERIEVALQRMEEALSKLQVADIACSISDASSGAT